MLELHDYVLSDRCYTVRLMLGLLRLTYQVRVVDAYPGGEQKTAAFRELNPFGDVPVLQDGAVILHDPGAILCHLAHAYDPARVWRRTGLCSVRS